MSKVIILFALVTISVQCVCIVRLHLQSFMPLPHFCKCQVLYVHMRRVKTFSYIEEEIKVLFQVNSEAYEVISRNLFQRKLHN